MLPRVLEPEVMDSPEEAVDYDAMDHREVNARFVGDFLAFQPSGPRVLDLGTGTAQIPIELCRRSPTVHIVAIDAASHMIELAARNVRRAGATDRIRLELPRIITWRPLPVTPPELHRRARPHGAPTPNPKAG